MHQPLKHCCTFSFGKGMCELQQLTPGLSGTLGWEKLCRYSLNSWRKRKPCPLIVMVKGTTRSKRFKIVGSCVVLRILLFRTWPTHICSFWNENFERCHKVFLSLCELFSTTQKPQLVHMKESWCSIFGLISSKLSEEQQLCTELTKCLFNLLLLCPISLPPLLILSPPLPLSSPSSSSLSPLCLAKHKCGGSMV